MIMQQMHFLSSYGYKQSSNSIGHKSTLFFKPLIQPELTINNPNDKYELEADAMADKVMRMQQPIIQAKPLPVTTLQRKCAACDEEDKAQRKEMKDEETKADNNLENYMGNLSSNGQPLPNEVRNFYEPRFGYDFSTVKIHTDTNATKSAQSINALAYTSGKNIVFNDGQFSPDTDSGKRLLGHELTHVVQQTKNSIASSAIQRSVTVTSPYPVAEDFDPGKQFKNKDQALGRSVPILNATSQAPRLSSRKFQNSLQLPVLSEKNLDEISRPDLSDSSLDPVRNNLIELKKGSFGKRVKLIQEALIAWGKRLEEPVDVLPKFGADQIFGGETKSGVEFFQVEHPFLNKDGVVGDLTLNELQIEMDKLHGKIFTLESAGHNDYTGLIHIPPPSKNWKPVSTTADEFFDNPTVDPLDKSAVAGKCASSKKFNIFFSEKESIIPSLLKHERFHEKDQIDIINNHLIDWDTRLEIAVLLKLKFKASDKKEAMNLVFDKSGADRPSVLSKKIIDAMIESNKKLHSGSQNVVPVSHLDIPDCNNLKISFTVSK